MGIRWLNEAESNNYLSYRNARRIEDRDQAVADELNNLTGEGKFGSKLNRTLGFGELSKFADSFKWSNMNADNPFIRLLNGINTYNDARPVKQILIGQKPTGEKLMNSEGNVSESYIINEAPSFGQPRINYGAKNDVTRPNTSVSPKASQAAQNDQSNQAETEKSEQPEQETKQEPVKNTQKMDANMARVLDLNAKEIFFLLYNGYQKKLFTTDDFAKMDDESNNNVQVQGRDGTVYSISSDLRDILDKCFEDPGWKEALNGDNKTVSRDSNNNSNNNLMRELKNISRDPSKVRTLGRGIRDASGDRYRLVDTESNNEFVESIRWLS